MNAPLTLPLTDASIPVWRQVLSLTWPVLVQQYLILLVDLSDRFLAGYFPPPDPSRHVAYQAAQTTANYIAWLVTCFTVFVSAGSTALVARFVGARDADAAVRVTHQSILLAVVLGLVGSVVGLLGLEGLVRMLGLTGDSVGYATSYLRPILLLLVFQVIEAAGIACLIGAGDTRTGMFIRGGVALINLPFGWGLFSLIGFEGIALGTALSHTLGALAVLLVLIRGRAGLHLGLAFSSLDLGLQRRLLRISVPAGADAMSVGVGQLWFLSIVNHLGNEAATAHGIALGWEGLAYMSGGAFGTAAMTLVGQNLGARRPDRARHSAWTAFLLACVVMGIMGAVFFTLAPWMFRLFAPNPEQQGVIERGVPVLQLVAFAMPALASSVIFTQALRGAGDTRVPVLFTWVGFFAVRIPLAYWLTQDSWQLGLFGAWLAMFADLLVRGAFFLFRFVGGRWQKIAV